MWSTNLRRQRPLCPLGIAGLGVVTAKKTLAKYSQYGYWGLCAGQSQSQIDDKFTLDRLLKSANILGSFTNEDQDRGYKLFGGYRLIKNFDMEASYFNLGKLADGTSVPGDTLNDRYEIEDVNLDLVGIMPLGSKWAALTPVGEQHANTRDELGGAGLPKCAFSDSGSRVNNIKFGLGDQYKVTPYVSVRIEAERLRMRDGIATNADVNYYSMSLVIPFGRKVPQKVAAVTPPVYMAPPSPPPPITLASSLPTATQAAMAMSPKVEFPADSLFTFDKALVHPEGRASLSQERTDAVKAYLVTNFGIDARKITATGRGKTNPETKPDDCKGNKPALKLIVCLQPDRRVFVEVAGER